MSPSFPGSRLTALLGMLESDHDGEVVNAGRLAARLVRSAGLTWDDVVPQPSVAPASPPPEAPPPPDWRTIVAAGLVLRDSLSAKEVDFLSNLASRTYPPTQKQIAWLEGIAERVLS